jgi:L-iditol 2-dehydrogenase
MKAMMLTGIGRMQMSEMQEPEVKKPTDVKIRMAVVGVCGSDIHYYLRGRIGSQLVQYPFIVGHEGAGVVEEVGSEVKRVKPGDHIAIDPAMPCRKCDQCLAGRPHTCRNLRFLGCPGQAEGCLQEFIIMPEESCYPLFRDQRLDQGAISEPLSIGVYAAKRSIPMNGTAIGILGYGPIGMSVMLAAKAQGAKSIYVTDKINARLLIAQKERASWVGNPDEENIVEKIKMLEPRMLDVVFECCGKQEAADQAIELLKPGGKLMIIGIPEFDRWSFSVDLTRHKEITVQNVRRQLNCVQPSLDYMHNGLVNIDNMISHRFPFTKANEAFDLVANYQDGAMKVMIDF